MTLLSGSFIKLEHVHSKNGHVFVKKNDQLVKLLSTFVIFLNINSR